MTVALDFFKVEWRRKPLLQPLLPPHSFNELQTLICRGLIARPVPGRYRSHFGHSDSIFESGTVSSTILNHINFVFTSASNTYPDTQVPTQCQRKPVLPKRSSSSPAKAPTPLRRTSLSSRRRPRGRPSTPRSKRSTVSNPNPNPNISLTLCHAAHQRPCLAVASRVCCVACCARTDGLTTEELLRTHLGDHSAPWSPVVTTALNLLQADLWRLWGHEVTLRLEPSTASRAARLRRHATSVAPSPDPRFELPRRSLPSPSAILSASSRLPTSLVSSTCRPRSGDTAARTQDCASALSPCVFRIYLTPLHCLSLIISLF